MRESLVPASLLRVSPCPRVSSPSLLIRSRDMISARTTTPANSALLAVP